MYVSLFSKMWGIYALSVMRYDEQEQLMLSPQKHDLFIRILVILLFEAEQSGA